MNSKKFFFYFFALINFCWVRGLGQLECQKLFFLRILFEDWFINFLTNVSSIKKYMF